MKHNTNYAVCDRAAKGMLLNSRRRTRRVTIHQDREDKPKQKHTEIDIAVVLGYLINRI